MPRRDACCSSVPRIPRRRHGDLAPSFDVDEDALRIGVHILSLAALDLLSRYPPCANSG